MMLKSRGCARLIAAALAAGLLAACESDGRPEGGDPGAKPLAAGQTCQDLKTELNRLQSRGAASKADAAASGRKLSDKDRAEANRYNTVLDQYLGSRCHL